jgi:4-amino-4-deoxy-L-arabinose transferase-like glycosyltransferase
MSAVASAEAPAVPRPEGRAASRWPLAALIVLAAALRFSTLDLQSFWYDEAFTPVHVLHASLSATMRAMVHTENTPPLWYLIEWADARALGTGEVALRLPSALAGIATVPVMWGIGRELAGRRAALIAAALTAVNPLFVWYSQEARAYSLFVLMAALAMLCFLRAEREPTRSRMVLFALAGSLALLTHYFAVFLLAPMVLLLLWSSRLRRPALPAIAALAIVGLALLPLISAQGGHGTQWIGRWALSSRLQAIPQYFLTGYSGAPLGHGVELLVALPILAGLALGLWCMFDRPSPSPSPSPLPLPASSRSNVGGPFSGISDGPRDARRGAQIALLITAVAVLAPIVLAVLGADYLAPRNLVGAMIPLSALIAVMLAASDRRDAAGRPSSPAAARAGAALTIVTFLAFLAVTIDVNLSPRLQRGNWREVARVLRGGSRERAITTVELGAAPLEYYLPPLHNLPRHDRVSVSEIDETGYAPLRPGAGRPPAPGFRLRDRRDIDGLIVYRFVAPVARAVSEGRLRRHVITLAHPEVLVPAGARLTTITGKPSAAHASVVVR